MINHIVLYEQLSLMLSWSTSLSLNFKKKTTLWTIFYERGSTVSRPEPLQGGSLLFTTKFPKIPGSHFIYLRKMKS